MGKEWKGCRFLKNQTGTFSNVFETQGSSDFVEKSLSLLYHINAPLYYLARLLKKMIVDLHIPCYVDRFFPDTALSVVHLLERHGCSVHYPSDQTCCGMPPLFDGFREPCREAGAHLIKLFQNDRYIVSPGTVCSAVIKCHYNDLFHNSSLHNEYKHLQKNLYELSTFMTDVLQVNQIDKPLNVKAYFLGGCAGVSGCISHRSSHSLLKTIPGLKLVSPTGTPCCGWGGTMARNDEKESVKLAKILLDEIKNSGADLIITNETGCLMHLMMVMKKDGTKIEIKYISELF